MKPSILFLLLILSRISTWGQSDENPQARLRLLIAITPAALDGLGGQTNAVNALLDAAESLNYSLAFSETDHQYDLVRTALIDFDESADFYDNVWRFHIDPYSILLRDRYKADVMVLVVDNASLCSLPLVLDELAESNTAYGAVNWRCMLNSFGLSHVVGHFYGAGHEPARDHIYPDDSAYPNGHGYSWNFMDSDCGFATIMAYDDDAGCEEEGADCKIIPYFSNPMVTYSGVPTGIVGESDNASIIRQNAVSLQFMDLSSQWNTSDTVANADLALLQGKSQVSSSGKYWVKDSAMVWFRAATKISLEPGFKVEEGAYFETILDSAMLDMR